MRLLLIIVKKIIKLLLGLRVSPPYIYAHRAICKTYAEYTSTCILYRKYMQGVHIICKLANYMQNCVLVCITYESRTIYRLKYCLCLFFGIGEYGIYHPSFNLTFFLFSDSFFSEKEYIHIVMRDAILMKKISLKFV